MLSLKNMNEYKEDTCFSLLGSVAQILNDVILSDAEEADPETDATILADAVLREKENSTILNKSQETEVRLVAECAEREILDDDANRAPVAIDDDDEPIHAAVENDDVEITQTLGYNRFMIDSVRKHGKIQLPANDVKKARVDAHARQECKIRTNRAVGNLMSKRKLLATLYQRKKENYHIYLGHAVQWDSFLIFMINLILDSIKKCIYDFLGNPCFHLVWSG